VFVRLLIATMVNRLRNRLALLETYYYCCYYYYPLFSQAFSSWYFSWTIGDSHRSGFKFHTAVLSVFCVMFYV